MFYSWKLNFGLFLSLFLVNISTDLWSSWQSCFNAVFSMSKQPEEHTLIQLSFSTKYQCWNNIRSSTLHWRCFVNAETTSINVRRLNFHFQPNINFETTLMNVDDQRCFNVDSALMCLLGWRSIHELLKFSSILWGLCQQALVSSASFQHGVLVFSVNHLLDF